MTMRVVQASFFRDPASRPATALLQAWPTLTGVANAACRAGVDTTVLQAHPSNEQHRFNDVQVCFTTDVLSAIGALQPDVVHVHGLTFAGATHRLCQRFRALPVIVQDHGGGRPARWREPWLRWGLDRVSGVMFTAQEQASEYRRILPRQARLFEVLESSCRFTPGDRQEARSRTGIFGDPAVLWIGRLDRNKDPLTALAAVRRAVASLPDLHFWLCYAEAPLLKQVQNEIAGAAELQNRVHWLGRVPHQTVEQLCRAADFFISTSHAEGSGYALIEALACGLTPIVTDIPSFRAITDRGRIGALVPVGNAGATAEALVRLAARPRSELRAQAAAHFQQHLTFDVVGRQLRAAYQALLA